LDTYRVGGGQTGQVAKRVTRSRDQPQVQPPNSMGKPRSPRIRENEAKIQAAIKSLTTNEFPSIRQASKHFNIPYETLRCRYHGRPSQAESHESGQLFSSSEEKALVNLIIRSSASGHPLDHTQLKEMAEEIRKRRLRGINEPSVELVTYDPIGSQWVQRFLQRHPELKSIMGKCIELARVKESTPEVIEHWFTILRQTIDEEKITWGNVYNADESGFGIGKKRATHVIIDAELKEAYQAEPGRQEWVTVMECACVDGSFTPPLIIFKGENLCRNWIPKDAPKN
jgi:hypothetical protein